MDSDQFYGIYKMVNIIFKLLTSLGNEWTSLGFIKIPNKN